MLLYASTHLLYPQCQPTAGLHRGPTTEQQPKWQSRAPSESPCFCACSSCLELLCMTVPPPPHLPPDLHRSGTETPKPTPPCPSRRMSCVVLGACCQTAAWWVTGQLLRCMAAWYAGVGQLLGCTYSGMMHPAPAAPSSSQNHQPFVAWKAGPAFRRVALHQEALAQLLPALQCIAGPGPQTTRSVPACKKTLGPDSCYHCRRACLLATRLSPEEGRALLKPSPSCNLIPRRSSTPPPS